MKNESVKLSVEVTYRVGIEANVSDRVRKGLEKIGEKFGISDDEANRTNDKDIQEAYEWLTDNIRERDAYSWEYEVNVN